MFKMTDKSRKFLEMYLPEVLNATRVNDILDPLYVLILRKGYISYSEGLNEFGREAD